MTGADPKFVCPICFNLDPDLCRDDTSPSVLDKRRIVVELSKLKSSAEQGKCLACSIICTGLDSIEESWKEGVESEDVDQLLLDETLLLIDLRPGHSLRVILSNATFETTVEFYTLSNDDISAHEDNASIPAFGVARAVSEKVELDDCLALATKWMNECDEKHPSCRRPSKSRLPTRVLDVGLGEDTDTIYLKETKDTDQGPYMSLSHCWGKDQIITTTTNTLKERKAGIKLSQLSKTFRHAVQITRGLNVRYLWIDSLCIIQDDKLDWELESAKMADVYMSSQLNIAATHSRSGKGGCFAERWSLDTLNQTELLIGEDIEIEPDDTTEGNYKIFCRHALHVAHDNFTRTMDYAHTMTDAAPLLCRAWVFQERLLSLRTLHFHAEELVWECASGLSCECSRLQDYRWGDPDGLLEQRKAEQLKMMYTSINSPDTDNAQVLDIWLDIVSEYCTLQLTNQMDRLPALSGLASRVAKSLSSEYLAGIWSQDLPRALCWQKDRGAVHDHPSFRDNPSGAPSWSWASMWNHGNDAPNITYNIVQSLGFVVDSRCRIQDFHSSPSGPNPFGVCGETWLKLQGALIQATFLVGELDRTSLIQDLQNGSAHNQSLVKYLSQTSFSNTVRFGEESIAIFGDSLDNEQRVADVQHGDSVYCLLLGHSRQSHLGLIAQYPSQYLSRDDKLNIKESPNNLLGAYALVLQKVDNGSTYRRVGFLLHSGGAGWWEGAGIADITLI